MTLYPFLHLLYLAPVLLFTRLYPTAKKLLLSILSTVERKSQEIKCFYFSFSSSLSGLFGKPTEFQYPGLFLRKL